MIHRINWSVFITFSVLLIAIASFLIAYSDIQTGFAIYWFDVNYLQWRLLFACLVIPVSIIALCLWMLLIKKGYQIRLWLIPIMVAANVIACAACIPGAAYTNEHEASVAFGNRVYDAMFEYAHGPNDDFVVLIYECDQFNFLCQIIYAHDLSDYGLKGPITKTLLVLDTTTNTIALQINGETVYIYRVE